MTLNVRGDKIQFPNVLRHLSCNVPIQAIVLESGSIMKSRAYLLVLEHPIKFAAAALAGFGVNGLAILVIKLASSLTLKVRIL